MLNFSYENHGTNVFLVYTMGEEELLDTTGIGMISNNKIPHVLPISFTQIDNIRYLRYNISSRISLDNFFSGIVNRQRLIRVLTSICMAVEAGAEYMLENEFFMLDERYIFANVATGEAELVYLPVLRDEEPLRMATFFKDVMFSTQFDSTEDCSYVARIINFLNNSENFSLKDFQQLLRNLELPPLGQAPSAPARPRAVVPAPGTPTPVPPAQPVPAASAQPASVPPAPPAPAAAVLGQTPPRRPIPVPPKAVAPFKTENVVARPLTPPPAPTPAAPAPQAGANTAQKEKKSWGLFGKKPKDAGAPADKASPVGFAIPGAKPDPADASPVGFAIPGVKSAPQAPAPAPAFAAPLQENAAPAPLSPPPAAPKAAPPQGFAPPQPSAPVWHSPAQGQPAQFGETSVLNASAGATTVLNAPAPQQSGPFLRRVKTGERFPVNKILFRIGTERSFVDCWVSDNSAVSHSHADIIHHDGKYFVRDNNSTNHTYLNGRMIPSNQEVALPDGASLLLGNEEFRFEIG